MTTASSMMQVMVPLYAASLGLGAQWLGVLIALPGLFAMLLALQAGRWVDGQGPARWFFGAMLGLGTAPAVLIAAPGVVTLGLSRILVGIFSLFVSLSGQSLTAGLENGRSHQANFATYTTWVASGRLFGPIMMGAILDHFGFVPSFYAVLGILLVAATLAFGVFRMVGGLRVDQPRDVVGSRKMFRSTLGNVGFQLAVFASAGIALALTVREAFLPVMLEELGMSATVIGTLVSAGSLTSVLIRPLMPVVSRLLGGTGRTLILAMGAVAVGIGLLSVAKSVAAFAALALLVGFGAGIGFPLSIVAVASHIPPRQRGMALGLRLSLSHLAETVVPVLSGLLVAVTGYAVGFGAAGLVLALLTVLALRRLPRFEVAEAEQAAAEVVAPAPAIDGAAGDEERSPDAAP